jgi:hypothetical protein
MHGTCLVLLLTDLVLKVRGIVPRLVILNIFEFQDPVAAKTWGRQYLDVWAEPKRTRLPDVSASTAADGQYAKPLGDRLRYLLAVTFAAAGRSGSVSGVSMTRQGWHMAHTGSEEVSTADAVSDVSLLHPSSLQSNRYARRILPTNFPQILAAAIARRIALTLARATTRRINNWRFSLAHIQ